MKFIISVDGRICSGKSTIISQLCQSLKELYHMEVPCFSCGEHYRNNLQNKIPKEQVDAEMIRFMRSVYENNDVAIIDGRSVSFAIKSGQILRSDKPLISVLVDIDKDIQLERLMERVQSNHPEPLKYALERDARDERRCFARYKKSIFDKQYYDLYLNTAETSVQESVNAIINVIQNGGNVRKKTLLFAEETDTPMGRKLLEHDDINTVYLRFAAHYHFTDSYLLDTYSKPVFIVSDTRPLDEEIQRFHNWSARLGVNPDSFYNGSEFLQEKSNIFARNLGLMSLTDEQILWTRDKVNMKTKLKSLGIPVPEFRPLENTNDVIRFAEKYGYPVVFKRRQGMSCIDTYKIENHRDLEQLPEIKPNKFMVEKFNDGKEWIIDGLVQDGKVLKIFITYVPNSPLTAMTEQKLRGHIAYNGVPSEFNFNPDVLIQSIVSGTELLNGYIHLECFVDKKGDVEVGEFGWRPAGHRIIDNHSYMLGQNIYDLIIDSAVGKPIKLQNAKRHTDFVGNVFLPKKSGEIVSVPSKKDLMSNKGVFDAEILSDVGDNNQLQRKSSETSGYAFVKGKTIVDVKAKMQKVRNYFYRNVRVK